MRHITERLSVFALLSALSLSALSAMVGCTNAGYGEEAPWTCTVIHDHWERCVEDTVRWCHALGEPHFHQGPDCAAEGLICDVSDTRDHLAYCVDPEQPCEPTTGQCLAGEAHNCLHGLMSTRPCKPHEICQIVDAWARCVPQ